MTNTAAGPAARPGIHDPAEAPVFKLFIAGEWVPSDSGRTFESRNPADSRDVIGRFQQ
jgi:hypothetical protein